MTVLLDDHVSSVELRPVRYQFSDVRGDTHHDDWLVIEGAVTTPEGTWSFTDPSLLIGEARQVAAWLRAVAAGAVAVTGPDAEGWLSPDTWFVEPVLALSLADRGEEEAAIRVHLSMEAAPPFQQSDHRADIYQYFVEVRVGPPALLQAADQWEFALASLPPRAPGTSRPC